ncbi:MAG TPA: hypothetical protein VMY78_09875 [Solirubrobacteraceae bacterium]|nr:hypothetical protein [Solirubrobacteraceae bacterium]
MSAQLRLVKVIVQPVFVIDDGEQLTEQVADPVHVSAANWPTYATTTFAEAVERLQSQLDASDAP